MEQIIAICAALFGYFVLKPLLMNDLNKETAADKIRKGAVVIDVRSEDEHTAASIEQTINIPLNRLATEITAHVPEKESDILLHCRTGSRSYVGKRALKKLGYTKVYNLGSFGRAKRIMDHA